MKRDQSFWDSRYAEDELAYGEAPNDFLAEVAACLPSGPVLCLAEGQGRNAVFLASRGHAVTAVDQSAVGLASAAALAVRRGVGLTTVVADLAAFTIEPGAWAAIVSIFGHLPPALRHAVHAAAVHGLKPGGAFVLEAYRPEQLAHGTGGPADPGLLVRLDDLRTELVGLRFEIARELERDVCEGRYHHGRAAVVQVLGWRD